MDLGAYTNIEYLDEIAKENNIDVPRLRGYRLMKVEEPLTKDEINNLVNEAVYGNYGVCDYFCCSVPKFTDSALHSFDWKTDRIRKKYMISVPDEENKDYKRYVGFRWNLIHGKAKKRLKLAIKHKEKAVRAQWEAWNRYAGRDDVLYIHARIGGWNWGCYGGNELAKEPWFLEKVDDSYDNTYCDIYAKINPIDFATDKNVGDKDEAENND